MTPTIVTRTLALAGFISAGKLSHSYRSLLPVLALCLATTAWSQGILGPKAPHRSSIMSGVSTSTKPAAETPASAQYKFVTIGVPGSANAQAAGINNAGLVSGYYEDVSSSSINHGFVWQNGAFQTVDYPGAVYTYLFGVNNQGVAIGLYDDASNAEHAVMYNVSDGTWAVLPDIPGYPENEGYGINRAGVAVGNAYSADFSTNVAWVWHPAQSKYSFFSVPGAAQYSTGPSAINDKGQIAGYFCTTEPCYNASFELYGFLKQGETYTTVSAPAAPGTYALGINNSGTIVGQWQDFAYAAQGFALTSGGLFTTVDYPGPEVTGLEGINDHGDICGTYVDTPSGARRAFIGLRK